MKNKLFELFICMLVVGTCLVVVPDTVSADYEAPYYYTLSGSPAVATITGYDGAGGPITIPSAIGGGLYPVVAIGDSAFNSVWGHNITSVIIPGSVTTIGPLAFRECSFLTSVSIPNNVTTIGDDAFSNCELLSSVTIGSGVTTIGNAVFTYCLALTTIDVSAGNIAYTSDNGILYNITKTTLIQCPGGKTGTVSIPSTVTTIGADAFAYCPQLTSVIIPNSVTTIEYEAFGYCYSLTNVIIPNSITTIGDSAFSSCTSLTSVAIPNNVTTIGDIAFGFCQSLTAINVNTANLNYASVDGVLYNKDITTLIQCPSGKPGTVSIPSTVTAIMPDAFSSCSLISIIIPESTTTIGNFAFGYSNSLTSITFLGLVAPTVVGADWIISKPIELKGHAYAASNFPPPGQKWHNLTMGSYIPGPPVIGTPSPINGSINTPLSLTWSIPINDTEGDIFNWFINCSNGQTNSSTGASNGTKSLSLSGLAYSTTYTVWVNATDPAGSDLYTRKWFTFTTNQRPIFGLPTPSNGSTNNPLSLSWSIPITDPDGDAFNWTVESSNGQKANGSYVTNGAKSLVLSGLAYSTVYKVWVNATDPTGSGLYTRNWFTFTTKASSGGGGTPPQENKKPVADLSAGEPYQGFVNTEIIFNGSKSSDPDGTITNWAWFFGDNLTGTGKTVTHTFSQAGNYTVTLTVTDNEGATHTDTTTCTITQNITQPNRPPTKPILTGTITGSTNTPYTYTVVSTDPDNDTIQYTFDWGDSTTNSSGFLPNGTSYTANHSWTTLGQYTITVTVTDNQTQNSSSMIITINAEEKKPSTPGFGLVIVLCSIAVAMFLWRKKKSV
jgi:PKD repeat protein